MKYVIYLEDLFNSYKICVKRFENVEWTDTITHTIIIERFHFIILTIIQRETSYLIQGTRCHMQFYVWTWLAAI